MRTNIYTKTRTYNQPKNQLLAYLENNSLIYFVNKNQIEVLFNNGSIIIDLKLV